MLREITEKYLKNLLPKFMRKKKNEKSLSPREE